MKLSFSLSLAASAYTVWEQKFHSNARGAEWDKAHPKPRVTLAMVADHIDHICQLAGDADHAAIGSDFDGGFGLQSVPAELDTVADLQQVASKLMERGYSESEAANVLGGNWLRFLRKHLPA